MRTHPQPDPFSGTWTLVPGDSQWPGPPPRVWAQDITCDADHLLVGERIVAATGEPTDHQIDARFDGHEYDVIGSALVDTIAYTRSAPLRIEGVARKSRRIVFHEIIAVSTDHRRLTQTISFADPNGQTIDATAVFERSAPTS